MRPSDLSLLHALSRPAVSPDGAQVVVAVIRPDLESDDYRGGLWLVPADGSRPARRLTHGWRDTEPAYSPDGDWLAFLRTEKGGRAQPYVMPTGGGEPRKVAEHPLGVGRPAWSPDSTRIAYTARVPEEDRYGDEPHRERPRRITTLQYRWDDIGFTIDRRSHVFVVDAFAEDARAVQITHGDYDHHDVSWSPDGTLLTFAAARHETRDRDEISDVWVCAPDGSGLRSLTRGGLEVSLPVFVPDGTGVCFIGADAGEDGARVSIKNAGVWLAPMDGGGPRRLTDEERFNRGRGAAMETGKDGVLFPAESRGAVDLLMVPYDGAEPEPLMTGRHQVDGVAWANGTVVATVADPGTCGEVVCGGRVLTSFGSIADPRPLEEVAATAPDGYPVHGWVVRPAGEGPHPVLLMIHGGPFTQYGWRLLDEAQVYAGAGFAVVMGNPRGSSGYGQAHGRHVIGDVGTRSAEDLLALLDAAVAAGGLDASRAGVMGGSHGGFMTTWLAAHHGDRFRAAISERAVNAIDSFHGGSDIGWSFAADLYGPDPAGWTAQSPLTYADLIDIPMLIIHSEQDWRCPVEQAQRLFVALKLRDVETEMLLFPGEGHELSRSGLPSHRLARFEAILDWWSRHLG